MRVTLSLEDGNMFPLLLTQMLVTEGSDMERYLKSVGVKGASFVLNADSPSSPRLRIEMR